MYTIDIADAAGEPVATILLDYRTGQDAFSSLLVDSDQHGWVAQDASTVDKGILIFQTTKTSTGKLPCFGAKFPGISTAVFVKDNYKITYSSHHN